MSDVPVSPNYYVRQITGETVQPDLTAVQLVRLMGLEVSFTDDALALMSADDRALVEKHSTAIAPACSASSGGVAADSATDGQNGQT